MSHWYAQNGVPMYEVKCTTKEGMRPTTITDARKLNLVPSVTTIIASSAKPALDRWKQTELLKATMELPRSKCSSDEEWIARVLKTSQEKGKNAANLGTQIHDQLERFFLHENHLELREYVDPALEALHEADLLGPDNWPENSFGHPLGFGGKVDLNGIDQLGNRFILDFKTKDTDDESKMVGYDDHCMQLAAYRVGLNLPNAKCYNLFISTKKPGLVKLIEWSEADLQRGWDMFYCLLRFWQLQNRFHNVEKIEKAA
jgi:hypothetical protein